MQFSKIAYKCVVSRPKDKWSMYQIYQSSKNISEDHSLSENNNEFPLLFGQPKNDSLIPYDFGAVIDDKADT